MDELACLPDMARLKDVGNFKAVVRRSKNVEALAEKVTCIRCFARSSCCINWQVLFLVAFSFSLPHTGCQTSSSIIPFNMTGGVCHPRPDERNVS